MKQNNINITALFIALFAVFLSFMWQGNKGFNLADEGYLWYGIQRVLMGEIPIRDFLAYDPGRYYWSAILLKLTGSNGIIGVRITVAIFQALGLFIGLLLITQSTKKKNKVNFLFLLLSTCILIVWMFPRHKLFDITLSILLIQILTFMVEKNNIVCLFFSGIGIGIIAIFGRNHGMYGLLAGIGVICWSSIRETIKNNLFKKFFFWGLGIFVGFFPIILMCLFIPDFFTTFTESIIFLFKQKSTNLPLPIPWPWHIHFTSTTAFWERDFQMLLVGLFFLFIPIFGIFSTLWVIVQKLRKKTTSPVLIAAAFLTIFYAHHSFSRADVSHLAQGIFPFLIGCLVILSRATFKIRWIFTSILCAASFWAMHNLHPGWQCMTSKKWVNVQISNQILQVAPSTANDITLLQQLAEKYAANEQQTFIAVPFWPGAYAILERKSPMRDIYPILPRSNEFERKEIELIKQSNPNFAIILDFPLDGRDELRYHNTHPLTYKYILDNFEKDSNFKNSPYQVFKSSTENM